MRRYIVIFLSICVPLLSVLSILQGSANAISVPSAPSVTATKSQVENMTWTWVNQQEIDATIPGASVSGGSQPIRFLDVTGLNDYQDAETGANPANNPYQFPSGATCTDSNGSHKSIIWANAGFPGGDTQYDWAEIWVNSSDTVGSNCVEYFLGSSSEAGQATEPNSSISIANHGNADISFMWSGTTITRIDQDSGYSFDQSTVPNSPANVYVKSTQVGQDCPDVMVINTSDPSHATLWPAEQGNGSNNVGQSQPLPSSTDEASDCYTSGNVSDVENCQDTGITGGTSCQSVSAEINTNGSFPIHIGGTPPTTCTTTSCAGPASGGGSSGSGGSGNGSISGGPQLSCDTSFSNPITWIVCPIIDAARGIIQSLDSVITNMLDVNGCNFFNTGAGTAGADPLCSASSGGSGTDSVVTSSSGIAFSNGYYQAWEVLRSVALAVVVIAGLIMVIAQAGGSEVFSAYTVKKTLPRMLIAVIGISLSWQLIQAMIQISDDLGFGVRSLIYSPFLNLCTSSGGTCVLKLSQTGSSAIAIVGAGALASIGLIGLLFFVLAAALAVLVAFVLITFREMVLIFFAIFAPVAIAMYILPGTEKVWKFWWSNMLKALIMFPLITAMIAIGRVFAVVVENQPGAGVVQNVTAIVAYFGPYFMIPTAFKMAGGIMSTIGNVGGRISSQGFGMARKGAVNQAKKNWQKTKEGERFSQHDWMGKPINKAIDKMNNAGVRVGLANKNFGFGKEGSKGAQAMSQFAMQGGDDIRQSKEWQPLANHDDAQKALMHDSAREAIAALTEEKVAKGVDRTKAKKDALSAVKAAQAAGFKFGDARVKTAAWKQADLNKTAFADQEEADKYGAMAAGGNRSTISALAGWSNATAKTNGRPDESPGFVVRDAMMAKQMEALQKGDKTKAPSEMEYHEANMAAVSGVAASTWAQANPAAVKNATKSLLAVLTAAHATVNSSSATHEEKRKAVNNMKTSMALLDKLQDATAFGSTDNQTAVREAKAATVQMGSQNVNLREASAAFLDSNLNMAGQDETYVSPTEMTRRLNAEVTRRYNAMPEEQRPKRPEELIPEINKQSLLQNGETDKIQWREEVAEMRDRQGDPNNPAYREMAGLGGGPPGTPPGGPPGGPAPGAPGAP